jgi:hypothetical protein
VHVFWHDSRIAGLGSTASLTSLYGTTSRDGGATWTPNYRVSDELSFFSFNTLAIPNLGDYNQAAGWGSCVIPAWTDQRLSTGDVRTPGTNTYTAGRGPDAYTTKVCFTSAVACPGPQILPRAAGSVLQFCVTNTGTVPDSYNYNLSDVTGWLAGGPLIGTIGPLDPGATGCINATVNVPGTCPGGLDDLTWSCTPVGDSEGGTKTCVTHVTCEPTVPVLVSDLGVQRLGDDVEITWTANDMGELRGWNVYRSSSLEGAGQHVNAELISAAGGPHFKYRDTAELNGTVFYRLAAVRQDGVEEIAGTISITIQAMPKKFSFALAGANPFRDGTGFSYSVPVASPVRIVVYNVAGQKVRTLVDRVVEPGVYAVPFDLAGADGSSLGAGVYLVKMQAGRIEKTVRVISIQ